MLKDCYIVHAKRTPIGKMGGSLSEVRVDDLLAGLFCEIKNWANFDLKEIDDIITGCANQAGEDNRNLSRMSAMLAGFPYEVPATTINRLCASSLDSLVGAMGRISMGLADCIVVGGAESMTRAPYAMSKGAKPFARDSKLYDTTFGWRFINQKMSARFPLLGMGETAEQLNDLYHFKREQQDLFALASHQKAIKAQNTNSFTEEIVPVTIKKRKTTDIVDTDEGPRAETTLEKMSKLAPCFREGGTVTPANSSSMNDGAASLVVVSQVFLKRHNLTPLVRLTGAGIRGVNPSVMGLGPVASTEVLMNKYNKKIDDFDVIELNEAFAAQALACIQELKLDPTKVNLNGGAIALGHPLGCSGARIMTTLTHLMRNNQQLKQGLATMCVGVGQGISVSVERC